MTQPMAVPQLTIESQRIINRFKGRINQLEEEALTYAALADQLLEVKATYEALLSEYDPDWTDRFTQQEEAPQPPRAVRRANGERGPNPRRRKAGGS